jgi:polysaccharide biosynthesis protein PelG
MAGIGFILRKFSRQDNVMGLIYAYTCAALSSTGPWILTVVALGCIIALGKKFTSNDVLLSFRSVIIYNFAFSLVLAGPITMIATRYLADAIHRRDVSSITGMMLGSLMLLYLLLLPVVILFYCFYANLSLAMAMAAIINFMLISAVWLTSIFISGLKDYKSVTSAYAIGLLIAVITSSLLANRYGAAGMLNGFSLGLSFLVAILAAQVFVEYPYAFKQPFAYLGYFKKYKELAIGGLVYNSAIWVDKWIMWFSPEAYRLPNKLLIFPTYDSAMFFAYLTIVPALALFMFSMETNFFEHYLRFYRDIQNKVTFSKIQKNHQVLLGSITSSAGQFLLLQASICALTILAAPQILHIIGGSYLQIGIFRFGVLGAFCHVMLIFLLILLSYFDNRKATLWLQLLFLTTNAGFTLVTLQLGFPYYGYGYFMSCLITFLAATVVTFRYVVNLPYHTFITTNSSV